MCIRDSVSVDSFLPVKMAVSDAAETSGFVGNVGPQPNSMGVSLNLNLKLSSCLLCVKVKSANLVLA